jgi:hypothetical protein
MARSVHRMCDACNGNGNGKQDANALSSMCLIRECEWEIWTATHSSVCVAIGAAPVSPNLQASNPSFFLITLSSKSAAACLR